MAAQLWKELGISRATYFRHKRAGKLELKEFATPEPEPVRSVSIAVDNTTPFKHKRISDDTLMRAKTRRKLRLNPFTINPMLTPHYVKPCESIAMDSGITIFNPQLEQQFLLQDVEGLERTQYWPGFAILGMWGSSIPEARAVDTRWCPVVL